MDDGGDLTVPAECVAWCREQDVGVSVCDDMAGVDLDWWNTRLTRHAIPTRIVGRNADGSPTDHGVGYLRRADLTGDCDGGQVADTSAGPASADLARALPCRGVAVRTSRSRPAPVLPRRPRPRIVGR